MTRARGSVWNEFTDGLYYGGGPYPTVADKGKGKDKGKTKGKGKDDQMVADNGKAKGKGDLFSGAHLAARRPSG